MSIVRLALNQDLQDLILKTPNKQGSQTGWKKKILHMEKHYEGSNI